MVLENSRPPPSVGNEEIGMNCREEIGAQIDAEIADEILEDGWQDGTDVEIEL